MGRILLLARLEVMEFWLPFGNPKGRKCPGTKVHTQKVIPR